MIRSASHNHLFLWTSIFFGILTTLINYQIGNNDHIEQLPILYRTLDANYLTNDFFVNSHTDFSPRYYYAHFVSFFAALLNIPWVFFVGTLLSNIAVSLLTYHISNLLFQNEKSAIIASAMVMCLPVISLGSDVVVYATMFTPTTLVFPFILLSFYFFLKNQLALCLITTGVVSIFHVLIGLEYGILFLCIAMLIDFLKKKSFFNVFKKTAFAFIIIAFLVPNLIPYLQSETAIEASMFIEILANFRHPHHYLLSNILSLKEGLNLLLIFILIIILFREIKRTLLSVFHYKRLVALGVLLAVALLLNLFLVDLFPVKFFTSLQLLRLLMIGKWILILFLAQYMAQRIDKKKMDIRMIVVCIVLSLLVFLAEISPVKTLLMVGMYCLVLLLFFKKSKTVSILFAGVLSFLLLTLDAFKIPFLENYPRSYFSSKHLTAHQQSLVDFVQSETPENAAFLSPHLFGFVRTEARRAIVADFKAFPFSEKAMLEWYNRIENCYGLDQDKFEEVYRTMNDQKIRDLHEKYEFDYAILYLETETLFPTVYSNSTYKIIDLTHHAQ